MRNKYQYLIIIAIVVIVYTFGFYIANNQEPLEIIYPSENTILDDGDFIITLPQGQVKVGSSSWEEIENILPSGKILGMSTIYSSNDTDCLFTFTKHENILSKIHISDSSIETNRQIRVGDAFDKVIAAYGSNYASVSKVNNKADFDIVYGADHTSDIFFHIRDNIVAKIILQNEPDL